MALKGTLRWAWGLYWRKGFRPGLWVGYLICLLLAVPAEKDALKVLFCSGPLHTVIAAWLVGGHLAVSLLRALCRRLLHARLTRAEFFRSRAWPQLSDWDMDPHWLGFDGIIEMCYAPNLWERRVQDVSAGWDPKDCLLSLSGEFPNAPRLDDGYKEWRRTVAAKKLEKDGAKYVLVNHPTSETDEHFVRLQVRKTKWSRVQACLKSIRDPATGRNVLFQTVDPSWRTGDKPKISLEKSQLPHALCLHGIVVTEDQKLLALQRPGPDKTDYHPHAWSFSFEEQLSEDDFLNSADDPHVGRWVHRAVRQEVLGADVDKFFKVEEARILAIAIEEPIFNPFVVALVRVHCESQKLAEILPHAPDRVEWLRYDFYSLDPPFDLLTGAFRTNKHVDGKELHPTSRYRVYMALTVLLPRAYDVPRLLAGT